MAAVEISHEEERLLLFMHAQHNTGSIDVDLWAAQRELDIPREELRKIIARLVSRGLIDPQLSTDAASLSLLGTKIARSLNSAPVQGALPSEVDASIQPGGSFLEQVARYWRSEVEGSVLSGDEKQRLLAAGEFFLTHPAVPELLRRISVKIRPQSGE